MENLTGHQCGERKYLYLMVPQENTHLVPQLSTAKEAETLSVILLFEAHRLGSGES